ncbi:M15 family metallopeptidase [Nonomuraea sp. SMC257]|uniref:M15 family metallopeptidase n=1 Tax=Nonomuraea montanisoli TaxID=2741721 RepID=A0A7Y6I8Q2_9ACTN|nr:M15 family metallopeptidase [Nonomuraea montanisoli]NUW33248.1 M15 family metallopeptidase [Nonomuraea montanisoli]
MSPHTPARTGVPRARRLVVAVVIAAIVAAAGIRLVSSSATSLGDVLGEILDAPGEADGVVPDGVTVFDDEFPAVARLDPDLLGALRRAAADAAAQGVELHVNSGWRSARYQEQLLRHAVFEYGSPQEAARWVAPADKSAHVSGDAVDLGPVEATGWLSQHGAGYGLCQIYGNESWHYELRPEAARRGCPPMYADPTHDPRMR